MSSVRNPKRVIAARSSPVARQASASEPDGPRRAPPSPPSLRRRARRAGGSSRRAGSEGTSCAGLPDHVDEQQSATAAVATTCAERARSLRPPSRPPSSCSPARAGCRRRPERATGRSRRRSRRPRAGSPRRRTRARSPKTSTARLPRPHSGKAIRLPAAPGSRSRRRTPSRGRASPRGGRRRGRGRKRSVSYMRGDHMTPPPAG